MNILGRSKHTWNTGSASIFGITMILISVTAGWSLVNLDLERDDYRIVHVSVFYVRAFLCIDRRDARKQVENQIMSSNRTGRNRYPTLIETGWPENMLPVKPHVFPDDLAHAHHDQECNGIIRAIGSAIDMSTGDLWVLDIGSTYCDPKTISFDLIGLNEETHRYSFPQLAFASIHAGPETKTGNHKNNNQTRIFLTLVDSDFIIVYAPNERKWWKVKFITNNQIVVPKALAFVSNGNMYIVDSAHHLWLTSKALQRVSSKRLAKAPGNYFELPVIFVDDLMGTACSMVVDPADHLYYYMPRDGVVVRWDTSKSLNAENHDVLYFASERVVQIVFGVKGSVWTIEERANAAQEHSHRILSHFTGSSMFANHIYKSVGL